MVKFHKLKKEDIDIILKLIATCSHSPEELEEKYFIDFNKIIPEPTTIEECPEDCRVKRAIEAHIEADSERPWFDWYTWHNEFWGTKWNAYDSYSIVNKSSITFVFLTAWSMPYPVIKRLKILGYDFDIRWADEDYGSNCGKISYKASEQDWQEAWEAEAYKDPDRFARNLWRDY